MSCKPTYKGKRYNNLTEIKKELDTQDNLREEIITSLLADNSFTVEINTSVLDTQNSNIPDFDAYGFPISTGTNTQYYSNLTVAGGTNYTENEIATPDITPNIKGHAQFSTDNGIGWFRSDEQVVNGNYKEIDNSQYDEVSETFQSDINKVTEGGQTTKTRRILEVQSDLFQKGRDKSNLSMELPQNILVMETQEGDFAIYTESGQMLSDTFKTQEDATKELIRIKKAISKDSKNQFLQLLNKKGNWINFFIQSIVQDSAKKGYEKVLFPKGDTASKIEGHETLEEFKKQKKDRIERVENIIKSIENGTNFQPFRQSENKWIPSNDNEQIEEIKIFATKKEAIDHSTKSYKNEIAQLKEEIKRVEEEGFGALKPIYNFYENRVTNILKKLYDVKEVTDEYGNGWNEIEISDKQKEEILLQTDSQGRIKGQANIDAMTVLFDKSIMSDDTIYHEYAHHYIAWNREAPIVKEAIKKWGSEENLVQAIGEQAAKQKGEALSWFKKFMAWLKEGINKLTDADAETLKNVLTDAFLTRADLSQFEQDLPDGDILEDFDEIENPDIGDELFKTTNEGKPINIKLAKKRLRRLLGKGVPVSIIDTIIEIGDIRAYGVASRAGIKLSELASMGTEYHEAFHIVFRNLNSKEDRQLLLDSVDVTLADIQRAKLLADKYNADPVEIAKEEKLADMFMEYMMGFDQLNIFQRIFKKISEFIAFVKGNLTPTQELFRDIRVGNYKDKIRFFPEERFKETTYTPSEEKQVINIALSRLDVLLSQRVKSGEIESMEEGYNTLFNETGGYLLDNKGSVFSEFYVRWKNSTGETKKAYETLILNLRNDLVLHEGKFKKVKGRSPKGNLYGKLLNRLHTRGLRFNGNEEVDLQDDIWKKYSNISVSVKENLSSRLKVLFNNLRMDVFDTLGLGYQLNYSGNEVFSIILSEIGGSINVDDMMEKIENSNINIVSRELLARIANKPILQKDLFLVAQKVHPTFYTVVETEKDKFSVIQSNRDSKRKLIRAEIYQAVGDQKEKLPLERVLPASVISNIGDKLNELQATFDKVLDQQGYEFTEFIKAVEKYYPNSYQDAHLNVEGERVYEWQNSNFIARQINKYNKGLVQDFYNKDVLYQDMPLFKDNKTLEFTYLDGIKPFGKSKGVKYRNYSDKDMLITLLEYFNISTKEMIVSLPILETAPTLAGIKVKKYSKNEAVEHIVNLAYNEYSRATSNPLNVKNYNKFQKEYLIFGDVIEVDNNGLFNPSKTKENILNKIERNTISFTRKLNSLGLRYDESIIKDFLANHILNHSQVMLFSVGDPAFYKSDVDYYKRAKEIHSPGTFLDTSELPDTFRVKVADDIEERSPQADEIEKVIGKDSDYNKSSLTDAQTYIDPISYRHRMIGLRRWTDKDQEAFEKIMVGEYSDINWQVLKPFYYDLHLMDIKDENDEILETKVVPVQKKDSEFTLYPVYGVKTINGKENPLYSDKYKEILKGMGYEFTDSSVKHNPNKREYDVFTFDTTIKVGKDLGNDIMTFNYDSWRLQQETPSHYLDDSGNLGTQIMKLITADIPQELHDLRDEYDQILNEDIKIAFEKVKENFNDEEKLKKTLQLEVLERGLGEEFIKSLEQLPYWHPIQTQRIQSIMNSMFRKNVSRRKFANGYSFINSSSYGKDLKIVWNDPNDPTKGVKYLEAYTPVFNSAFEKFRDEDGLIDMEKIKGTPEEKMLEGVVYRIPTEDKFSMIPIKVVGFLPSNSSNIMLPHEVTTMAGLDFDIDKVFGFYYGLTPPLSEWVKNKKVPKEIYDKYSEAKQEVIDYFNNEKYAEAFELRELKYQVTQENDPLLKSRLRLLEKKVDPKLIQDLEERKDTLNELKEDLQREKEEYYREEYEKVIGQVVRDNRKLDIIKQILSHESTTKALLTPQGFQDIVKVNEQLDLVDKEKLDYTDPLTLVKIANRMNAGQSILGVYANANAVNAVLQYSEKPLIMKRAAVFDGDAYTQLGRKDLVERITKALGMRIGMSADNGKDPQAEYYNSNIYTAPVESMLLMLGIPSQTTQMFLAQPILKEFTKMYFNNGGTKQAENDLMTKLNLRVDANQPVSNISSDVLKSEILEFNKLTTEKQKADFLNRSVQKELLKNFMIYKLRSDKFNDFVTAVKLGDVGAGTNQVGNLFKMNKFLGQFKFIENAREFIKSDNFMMTMFREGIIKADEEINKYLIPLEAGFRNMIYSLEENKGYAMTEKEIQDVLNNVYTFVFQKVFNVRKKDIKAAINLLPKLKKKYPDNALLKRMNVIDGYIEFIGAIGNDYSEIDEIKRAWNELEQKEIETLIKYSFGQSGVTQTFKGFGHMQPVDFHIELLRKYPEIESELRNTLSNLDPQFMELYIRNNYKSSTTVPNISEYNIVYSTETDLELNKPRGTYIKYKGELYKQSYQKKDVYSKIPGLGVYKNRRNVIFEYNVTSSEYNKSNKSNGNKMHNLRKNPEDYLTSGEIQKICD